MWTRTGHVFIITIFFSFAFNFAEHEIIENYMAESESENYMKTYITSIIFRSNPPIGHPGQLNGRKIVESIVAPNEQKRWIIQQIKQSKHDGKTNIIFIRIFAFCLIHFDSYEIFDVE